MEISSQTTAQSMQVISAQLAKSQQKQEGAAVMELLASSEGSAPKASSGPANLGSTIDVHA